MSQVRKFQPGGSAPTVHQRGTLTINGTVHDMNDAREYAHFAEFAQNSPSIESQMVMSSVLSSLDKGFNWTWNAGKTETDDFSFNVDGFNPGATDRAARGVSRATANARAFFNTDAHKINVGMQRLGDYYFASFSSQPEETDNREEIVGGNRQWWVHNKNADNTFSLQDTPLNTELLDELEKIKEYFNSEDGKKIYKLSNELSKNERRLQRFSDSKKSGDDPNGWVNYMDALIQAASTNTLTADQKSTLKDMLYLEPSATSGAAGSGELGGGGGAQIDPPPPPPVKPTSIISTINNGNLGGFGIKDIKSDGSIEFETPEDWEGKIVLLGGFPEFEGTPYENGAIYKGKLYTHEQLLDPKTDVGKFFSDKIFNNTDFPINVSARADAYNQNGIETFYDSDLYHINQLANDFYFYDDYLSTFDWARDITGATLHNGTALPNGTRVIEAYGNRTYNNEIGIRPSYIVIDKNGTIQNFNSLNDLKEAGYSLKSKRKGSSIRSKNYVYKGDDAAHKFSFVKKLDLGNNIQFSLFKEGNKYYVYSSDRRAFIPLNINDPSQLVSLGISVNKLALFYKKFEDTSSAPIAASNGIRRYNAESGQWETASFKHGGLINKFGTGGGVTQNSNYVVIENEDGSKRYLPGTSIQPTNQEQVSGTSFYAPETPTKGVMLSDAAAVEMGGAALDLLGAIASTFGASPAGTALGLAGTAAYTAADMSRSKDATGKIFGNGVGRRLGMNLAFDAVSILPFIGGIAEGRQVAKAARVLLNGVPFLASVGALTYSTSQQWEPTMRTLQKIADGGWKNLDTDDFTNLTRGLQTILGITNMGRSLGGRYRVARDIQVETSKPKAVTAEVGTTKSVDTGASSRTKRSFKTEDGKKVKVTLPESVIQEVRGKSVAEANDIIKTHLETEHNIKIDDAQAAKLVSDFKLTTKSESKGTVRLEPEHLRAIDGMTVHDAGKYIQEVAKEQHVNIDPSKVDALVEAFGFKTTKTWSRKTLPDWAILDKNKAKAYKVDMSQPGVWSNAGFFDTISGQPFASYFEANRSSMPSKTYNSTLFASQRASENVLSAYGAPARAESATPTSVPETPDAAPAATERAEAATPKPATTTEAAPEIIPIEEVMAPNPAPPATGSGEVVAPERTTKPQKPASKKTPKKKITKEQKQKAADLIAQLQDNHGKGEVTEEMIAEVLSSLDNFATADIDNVDAINASSAKMKEFFSRFRNRVVGTKGISVRSSFDEKLRTIKKKHNLKFKEGGLVRKGAGGFEITYNGKRYFTDEKTLNDYNKWVTDRKQTKKDGTNSYWTETDTDFYNDEFKNQFKDVFNDNNLVSNYTDWNNWADTTSNAKARQTYEKRDIDGFEWDAETKTYKPSATNKSHRAQKQADAMNMFLENVGRKYNTTGSFDQRLFNKAGSLLNNKSFSLPGHNPYMPYDDINTAVGAIDAIAANEASGRKSVAASNASYNAAKQSKGAISSIRRHTDNGLHNNADRQITDLRLQGRSNASSDSTTNRAFNLQTEKTVSDYNQKVNAAESAGIDKFNDQRAVNQERIHKEDTATDNQNRKIEASKIKAADAIESATRTATHQSLDNARLEYLNRITTEKNKVDSRKDTEFSTKLTNFYNTTLTKKLAAKYQQEYANQNDNRYSSLEEYVKNTHSSEYADIVKETNDAVEAERARLMPEYYPIRYPWYTMNGRDQYLKKGGSVNKRSVTEQLILDNNRETKRAIAKMNDNIIKLFTNIIK